MSMLRIEARTRNPAERHGYSRDNLADFALPGSRPEATRQSRDYWQRGYWVEVYHESTNELMAGPIDPDEPFPSYIV